MGLTQKLGTIPLAILTDASNNVGIGAAPSGSYKLEVTGTAKVSGITSLTSATASTSTTTGGLVVTGGLGIGGALFGTSATFSAGITSVGGSNQEITASATGDFFPRLKLIRTGGITKTNRNWSFDLGSNGTFFLEDNTASATRLSIDTTGAATFSSTVAVTTTGTTAALQVNLPADGNATILSSFGSSSAFGWYLRQDEVTTGDWRIFRRQANVDYQVLNLSRGSGAATFSSSVTASDFISTSNVTGAALRLLGGGTSVMYQKWANDGGNYFIGISSSTGAGLLSSQNAYSMCLVTESARDMSFGTTNTERMRITSGGDLIYGNSSVVGARAITLHNASNGYQFGINSGCTQFEFINGGPTVIATINGATGVYTALSDINKKKDFEESIIGLTEILQLKPTLYRFKDGKDDANKELGFIAQEVKEFIPQSYIESGDEDNKFIGLNYNPIVAALVKAMQEQNQTIQELSKQNEELSNRLIKAGL